MEPLFCLPIDIRTKSSENAPLCIGIVELTNPIKLPNHFKSAIVIFKKVLAPTEPNLEVSHGLRKPQFSYKNSELVILLVENVAPIYYLISSNKHEFSCKSMYDTILY